MEGAVRGGGTFTLLGEQLKQASRAYEACLARHSVERRHIEAQVSSLLVQLQSMGGGFAATAVAAGPMPIEALAMEPPKQEPCMGISPTRSPTGGSDSTPSEDCEEDSSPIEPPATTRMRALLRDEQPVEEPANICAPGPVPPVRLSLDLPTSQLANGIDSSRLGEESETSSAVHIGVVTRHSEPSERGSQIVVPTGIIRQRLLARLGHLDVGCLITGQDLHQAVSALGLERYSLKEMNYLVHKLALLVNLRFRPVERPRFTRQLSQISHMTHMTTGDFTHRAPYRRTGSELASMAELAEWHWPELPQHELGVWGRSTTRGTAMSTHDFAEEHHDKVLPMKALIKAMTVDDASLKKLLGSTLSEQLGAIKEVLITGDANRLVSELTCVRIDDLATRKPQQEWYVFEPLVGLLIVANGVAVGLQTDTTFADWRGWLWVEIVFTGMFFLEMCIRQVYYGVRMFLSGPDRCWNLFDVFLLSVGIMEVFLTAMQQWSIPSTSMIRVVRFLKLVRLVRIFRLRVMRELQLMIKGLMGGLRTLCWAFVLLTFILYVLGVICFSMFADDSLETISEMFSDVPTAMTTAFRCVIGDCFSRQGYSITSILSVKYGLPFCCSFFVAYITITLGVFNVILAIYVETTMTAAKLTEGRHERESIRVAHITKRLLKLFCAAEEVYNRAAGDGSQRPSLDMKKLMCATDLDNMDVNDNTSISKELFLIVIQEPEVQRLMDELDIPPDRASLFDSIDADGSGNLHATELVMGLLKVRGEVKKSDQVACILALRAVQSTLRQMDSGMKVHTRMLEQIAGSHRPSRAKPASEFGTGPRVSERGFVSFNY